MEIFYLKNTHALSVLLNNKIQLGNLQYLNRIGLEKHPYLLKLDPRKHPALRKYLKLEGGQRGEGGYK